MHAFMQSLKIKTENKKIDFYALISI